MREFELIDILRSHLAPTRPDTRLGIGDDAAILVPPAGCDLAVTTDSLISGRHFHEDTPPEDIGFKSMAVNLSDLAAMGAQPAWLTVSLATPSLDAVWCEAFVKGMLHAARDWGADIVGGDTTQSPVLMITVTAMGIVSGGQALRRDAARVGDLIAVTGTLGDAARGLELWPRRSNMDAFESALISRLTRPTPRQGSSLIGLVHAAADVSDGLLADLRHILRASHVGATVNVDQLPCSEALARSVVELDVRRRLQASGGDDYELCVTLAPGQLEAARQALNCPLTVIGRIEPGSDLRLIDADGSRLGKGVIDRTGWDHFATGQTVE